MATALRTRTDGLHHAVSLGNIDATSQGNYNYTPRNYDSEDENLGRLKNRQQQNLYIKPPIYSKEDIIDQYCLTDKQLNNSIEPPRRDRFFGCWSTRSQQSFLGVCVGRRAPSDENLQDYAPISRYPRYQRPISYDDDDLENSYFRRKPTSFLSSDAKRHTWVTMNNSDDSNRLDESRLNRNSMENGGPYVVETYPQKSSFLSQSTEQITGYRCPAHINLPANATSTLQNQDLPPRTKHVSFARSLTLASFDDAAGMRQNRILNARSQERLIGGKKPTITISHQQQIPTMHVQAIPILQKPQLQQTLSQPQIGQLTSPSIPETNTIEKHKRNVMKTQATQTEVFLGRKMPASQTLSLSPRTVHRVRMVSQGAQTNGMNGRKLSKSFSEMGTADAGCQYEDENQNEHELLCRTQSEESPKSPIDMSSYLKPSTGYMMTTAEIHAQTLSRQSQLETLKNNKHENFHYHHTYDSNNKSMETNNLQDNFTLARRGSTTLSNEPIFIGRNELEQMRVARPMNPYEFESHSLPRRTCIHHKPEEYTTHSLPRREHHHHYLHEHSTDMKMSNNSLQMEQIANDNIIQQKYISAYQDAQPSYVNMNTISETYSLSRRSSMQQQQQQQQVPSVSINLNQIHQQQHVQQKHCNQALQQVPPSDEMCSTCSSETEEETETETENEDEYDDEEVNDETEVDQHDEEEEKEIFIDFKPHFSPTSNASTLMEKKKKRLVKAMSQGEMLIENNERNKQKPISMSEEDLKHPHVYTENLHYTDTPIRDEDICRANNLFNATPAVNRYDKETFRKRSISLEDPLTDDTEGTRKTNKNLKANYSPSGSPGDGRSFASSDDITRDHSEGNWNESQVTVLPCPPSPPDINTNSHQTSALKRKNILQQQRSSLDIEAIDDIADQPLPPLPTVPPPPPQKSLNANINQNATTNTLTTPTTAASSIKPSSISTTAPTVVVKPTPSIAVTHSQSIDQEDNNLLILPPHPRSSSPSKKRDVKKYMQHKNKHSAFDKFHRSNESLESSVKSNESILNRNDVSEGSTTEDYMTCTDNSKRTHGLRYGKGVTFPTTQMQGTVSTSQTVTIDGSSFESASSFHSLARIDAICEDATNIEEKIRSSPIAHSDSSTSSGSYRMPPMKVSSPSRSTLVKPAHISIKKNKKESVSDDERSEKFQSSSHDEKDHKIVRLRKPKEWSEEERRRKKGNFKLEIEKESSSSKMTLPSTFGKTGGVLKKISPDDKTALNVLDGASPSKQKPRFRGKTRKTPRNRTPIAGDENMSRRSSKTLPSKSPEKMPSVILPQPQQPQKQISPEKSTKLSPSKFIKPCPLASPAKQLKKPAAGQRLKAISTESLRSVSPGSDSVFYNSEADALDHQIHCHHCGKEVEVVTAVGGGSEESVVIVDDGPDIVQPPEGFADSPNGISKVPPALKYYKRFRSEDRRHKKGRNGRAKSEERNSEDITNEKLRAAGSSPCVGPSPFSHEHHDPEQGVYHGTYSHGSWIFISDKDFWRKNEIPIDVKYAENSERRASTESEKEFRKKYQAITHRLVHRKSCVEMYRRQSSNSFDTDKCVVVQRVSGEFGFRIHGSKPVVVSAIEEDTPAQKSGLQVGDIVLSVNGISVVDKSHSEVVKIAHAGSDTLELEVARTMNSIAQAVEIAATQPMFTGFLWRKSQINSGDTVKWVRRWFCLRTDQCLYYYKNESDVQPVGIVLLTNHSISALPSEKSNRPFTFSIESSDSKVILTLAAECQETANSWIAILNHSAEQSDPWLDISTRNLKIPPTSIARPDCVGYLTKLGLRWRSWTKRYCVLKDACLYFYADSSSKVAIGMACLQGYRVQPFATGGKKYAFELVPAEPKYRNYYFHTDSEMDKKRWVAALEYSIDRWMKAN